MQYKANIKKVDYVICKYWSLQESQKIHYLSDFINYYFVNYTFIVFGFYESDEEFHIVIYYL